VVDHDVVRFDVPVHDTHRVAEVQRLEELVHVIADVVARKGRVERLEILVVHIFEDERRRLGLRIADDVQQLDDVRTTAEVLEDLNLAFDLSGG